MRRPSFISRDRSASSAVLQPIVTADVRLGGVVFKKNAGFLRQWRARYMVVTIDGFLRYDKKKGDGVRTKKIDLVKSDLSQTVTFQNGMYCIDVLCGQQECVLGYEKQDDARIWQEVLLETADENAAGRRAWVANFRRALKLPLRERRDVVVQHMMSRDWMSEWRFCWQSQRGGSVENFGARRRRLKRMYTMWLQFHLFTEIVAEMYLSSVQSHDSTPRAPIVVNSTEVYNNDDVDRSSQTTLFGTMTDGSTPFNMSQQGAAPPSDPSAGLDVDVFQLPSIRFEYGSRSWRGHKRLEKEVTALSHFRHALGTLVAERGLEDAMGNFPMFPLQAAFTMRGIRIVATAVPVNQDVEAGMLDRRDIADLMARLRANQGLNAFSFREFPDVLVRKFVGSEDGSIVHVDYRYSDIFYSSLRSSLVHGVLINQNDQGSQLEILSAHDVEELVQHKNPRWMPVLDLLYYRLKTGVDDCENMAAKKFLLKRQQSGWCVGTMVIAVDPNTCRLPVNLKEAFVMKNQMELHPLLRKLQDAKSTSLRLQGLKVAASAAARRGEATSDVVVDLENNIKHLVRRHIQRISSKFITLGEVGYQSTLDQAHPHALHPSPNSSFVSPQSFGEFNRQRSSSTDSTRSLNEHGALADSIYVIDGRHLRQVLKSNGVNLRFLPLVFSLLSDRRQPGVKLIVACEIIARIAKNLFRCRLYHDQSAPTNQWRSRKTRIIKFIQSIMRGATRDYIKDPDSRQFWQVDALIWHLLGPYSSSIALSDPGTIGKVSIVEVYRQRIVGNPHVLFTSLLHAFGAYISDSYLPLLDETRFESFSFFQHEVQLKFVDEAIDPKLAIRVHPAWVATNCQFFRHAFASVRQSYIDGGGTITDSSVLQNEESYFSALLEQFHQSLNISIDTRLEGVIRVLDMQTVLHSRLWDALVAVRECHFDSAKSLCKDILQSMEGFKHANTSVPVEAKLALLVIDALSFRGPVSPTNDADQYVRWKFVLEWLRFFYRPALCAQSLPSMCSHPLAQVASTMLEGASPFAGEALMSGSLRARVESSHTHELWEAVMPSIDPSKPSPLVPDVGSTAHTRMLPIDRSQSAKQIRHDLFPQLPFSNTGKRSSSASGFHGDSATVSTRDQTLQILEQYVLSNHGIGDSWKIPATWCDRSNGNNANFPPDPPSQEKMVAPGIALVWGKPAGLSLDDESKLGGAGDGGVPCRPKLSSDIHFLTFPCPMRLVTHVSCGYRHTALITGGLDQQLYTFGYGECGRLGHGDEESVIDPKLVSFFANRSASPSGSCVVQVSCGREHTMVVLRNGELFGFGWAEAGRLGTGESGGVLVPSKVVALTNITAVACGREHTLALNSEGQVFAFGAGFGGRLGNNNETDEDYPVRVTGGLDQRIVVGIDAGECHSAAVTKDGEVYTWGFGASGAIGNGSRENVLEPAKISGPWEQEPTNEMITDVACGSYHTLACSDAGKLYGWGDAAAGQLGEELINSDEMVVLVPHEIQLPHLIHLVGSGRGHYVHQIACGTFTSAVCTEDGTLYTWGSAAAGNGAKLNIEDATIARVAGAAGYKIGKIACGAYHAVAVSQLPTYS